jgi:cell wall-associated NlpC family hydrolase
MDWSDFVGLPWSERGRGPQSYDCWGLLRAAFEVGTGIELPSHAGAYSAADQAEVRSLIEGSRGDWNRVPGGQERAFDGVVMRLNGELHVGIVVRRGRLLHVRRGALSAIEPISRFGTNDLELYRHRRVGQS